MYLDVVTIFVLDFYILLRLNWHLNIFENNLKNY